MLINRCVFLYIGVGTRNVGLRLVVVVIGNEILNGVTRKKFTHLPVELCRQCLVGGQHNCRTLRFLDDIGQGKGLAGTGNAEQCLTGKSIVQSFNQAGNSGLLITCRIEFRHQCQAVTIVR